MIRDIYKTGTFKRDLRKAERQGKDLKELFIVIERLANGNVLEEKSRDHGLSGDWKNHRECHIRPDWLLIYRIADNALYLERTGSHSELFN